ncbi:MAG: hypothetical protein NVSMB31_18560 [Vulcanimicrobiaceae bacterium]
MSQDSKKPAASLSRGDALKLIAIIPAAAVSVAALQTPAQASDNKKQFKYQDRPGKHGQKCSGCSLFRAPHGCKVVTGKISPNGWCVAWAKK